MTVPDGCRMTAGLLAPRWGRICMRRLYYPSTLRQQQGAVAEFMPEIAVFDGLSVARGAQVWSRDAPEQQQVRRAGVMPTGDQAVAHPARAARTEHQIGPANG